MSGMNEKEDPSPSASAVASRTACAVCGRDDSGAWYWSDQLQRVICIDCHWRLPAPPPTNFEIRKP